MSLALMASLSACEDVPQVTMADSAAQEESSYVLLGGSIRAELVPAPMNADPNRVWQLVDPIFELAAGNRINDIHRIAEGYAVVKSNQELWYYGPGESRRLDEDVNAPIGVRGTTIVYARGLPPELEVARVELRGEPEQLTEDYAPVWNPALGPDGDVVFVSGRTGGPALYRVEAGQAPERIINGGLFPSSLEPPTFDGRVLRFRDEADQAHEIIVRTAPPSVPPANGTTSQ